MLNEKFVESIATLAKASVAPPTYHPEAEPKDVYFIGEKRCVAERLRRQSALSIATLVDMATWCIDNGDVPEFWSSRTAIMLYTGLELRETVTMNLTYSPQLKRLQQWESSKTSMKQSELILILRTFFRDSIREDLTNLVRRIKTTVTVQSDQKRTGASLGKAIEAQINDQTSIPDYVTFLVPIFEQGSLGHLVGAVDCAFEFDAETQLFQLIPVAGTIERAIAAAEMQMIEAIRSLMGPHPDEANPQWHIYHGNG